MKFKITKSDLIKLSNFFSKDDNDYVDLEIEPVDLTAAQAIREVKIREEGYLIGKREGWLQAHDEARRMRLGLPPKAMCHCHCHCC